jgi:mycofactocin system glycosyltransferase
MKSPSREDTGAAARIASAPDRAATPLPGAFGLSIDPSTARLDHGRVLMGGSPLRLLRITPRAGALVQRWEAGAVVGPRRAEGILARRLVAAGIFLPRPGPPELGPDDVTVVIPVRDRPAQLHRLLGALEGLRCIVVDDGSADGAQTRAIAREAGAAFIALDTNQGPSAARNAGLAAVTTALVAFVDSDCQPAAGWLLPLLGHFDDPLVAAVAPRVTPISSASPTPLSRYEAVRSSLDRGASAGLVRPLSRIPYVPSAALVVRRTLAPVELFDPALRGGEDVDLIWRLVEAGWDVRYEPQSVVEHDGPAQARAWLGRRAFYGATAGPLSRRHPGALAPVHTSAWTAAVWALAATRRPVAAMGVLALSVAVLARRLRPLVDEPMRTAASIAGGGTAKSTLPAWNGLVRAWSPAFVLGLCLRRTRRAAAVALLVPALGDWVADRAALDPVRYSALHMADDVAYGTGVWRGCISARTLAPLLPRITFRARVWSSPSLRRHLGRTSEA